MWFFCGYNRECESVRSSITRPGPRIIVGHGTVFGGFKGGLIVNTPVRYVTLNLRLNN